MPATNPIFRGKNTFWPINNVLQMTNDDVGELTGHGKRVWQHGEHPRGLTPNGIPCGTVDDFRGLTPLPWSPATPTPLHFICPCDAGGKVASAGGALVGGTAGVKGSHQMANAADGAIAGGRGLYFGPHNTYSVYAASGGGSAGGSAGIKGTHQTYNAAGGAIAGGNTVVAGNHQAEIITACGLKGPLPKTFTFDLAGLANGPFSCGDCANLNITVDLDHLSGCQWRSSAIGFCGDDRFWNLIFLGAPTNIVRLRMTFSSTPTFSLEYRLPLNLFKNWSANTLVKFADTGHCTNAPFTVVVRVK